MGRAIFLAFLVFIFLYQITFVKCQVEDQSQSGVNQLDNPSKLVSVSPSCDKYNVDNLPHPRFILLGPTGVGKSTLANQLLGRDPYDESQQVFSVGHDMESHTLDITYAVGNWLGNGPCFTIIDTPGSSDSEGRDYEHALAMANIMKNQIKSVDIFLLCFSGQVPRFDQSIIDLLKLYESIYSKKMWEHAVTEVTYWAHDTKSVRNRKRTQKIDEMKRHKLWNDQYKEELKVMRKINSVYIDPVLPIFDPVEAEYIQKRARDAFKKYTDKLLLIAQDTSPFICDGNCKAPNGYFLGKPWIKTKKIIQRQGDKVVVTCQIWNGKQGIASDNLVWTHNDRIIYEKKPKVKRMDDWGDKVKFVENESPGAGHTDFSIEFDAFETSMEGKYVCRNGKVTDNNFVPTNFDFADVFMKVDFSWAAWNQWSQCSESCGYGKASRMRECNEGAYEGKMCPKTSENAEKSCKIKDCPRKYKWVQFY